jgi:hypothetical protein
MRDGFIICSLGHRFDARRAGASAEDAGLHLDPLPLLTKDGVVKVALSRNTDLGDRAHAGEPEPVHP